jgi:hypothetical protein
VISQFSVCIYLTGEIQRLRGVSSVVYGERGR